MENVEKKVSRHHLHYLYVIFDFLVTSVFVFISFLTFYWAQLESMNVLFVSLLFVYFELLF